MINKKNAMSHYPCEEKINIISHAVGILLSVVALIALVVHVSLHGNGWHGVSFSVFGVSLVILYTASTCYHCAKNATTKRRMRTFDHAAIYILIAGTYTPFTLVTLNGSVGWVLFGLSWGMAITGICLKLFFTGRFKLLSTLMYILMGWMIIFAIKPLAHNLPTAGLVWLAVGGLVYTLGAAFYMWQKLPLNHAVFHIFVLAGSACQFISVFNYVLV